jgi:hypothetical protein
VNYQTSFLGFLYEPIAGNKAAWSLGFNGQAYGPTTIPFNSLLLLEGVTWNSSTRQLTILTAGTYYLKLSGVAYPLTYMFRMGLIVNSQPEPLMSVMDEVTSPIRTHYYTERTRALITTLQQGDTLEVGVPAGYEAGHDRNRIGLICRLSRLLAFQSSWALYKYQAPSISDTDSLHRYCLETP